MQAIFTAASGIKNMQTRLDTIASNIANINTIGYKAKRLDFKDTLYKALVLPDEADAELIRLAPAEQTEEGAPAEGNGEEVPPVETILDKYVLIGSGVRISSTTTDFKDGATKTTGTATDLAISGRGFFTLESDAGERLYTRNGSFTVSSSGYLVNANGYFVLDNQGQRIMLTGDTFGLKVSDRGELSFPDGYVATLGLADFNNLNGLEAAGDSCYRATAASGQPLQAEVGAVLQGYLENSNVDMANDLTMLIRSQRAFSLMSKALQTADDMEGLANNIHN
ncbi:MAG: flagellar hook-basal body protein [Papillibacter sp.]|jgi:flagellar basal-body rod protein FlgG|nr:flagellar hook-basal body protein [Papillibacter sp.]